MATFQVRVTALPAKDIPLIRSLRVVGALELSASIVKPVPMVLSERPDLQRLVG